MKGYRAEFYNPDPMLHSIEILAWATDRDSFTIGDVRGRFGQELAGYEDAEHEISERIRKLVKSGNLIVLDPGAIKTLTVTGVMNEKTALALAQRLDEIQNPKTDPNKPKKPKPKGRKPRLYRISQTGAKYVETRRDDLEKIYKGKKAK